MVDGFPFTVIGLGANLGSPLETFSRAVTLLGAIGELVEFSRVYRSEAQGPPQPDFHNAAVGMRFGGEPLDLLRALMEVEQTCGRLRRERWGPRLLDLDFLWIEGARLSLSELTVPHPRLTQRAFALRPLLDVVPWALDPITGRPYTSWLAPLEMQRIEVIDSPGAPWRDATDCRR